MEAVEPAFEGDLGAVFVVVIVFLGLVRTRQNLGTMQSELEAAERATDQRRNTGYGIREKTH